MHLGERVYTGGSRGGGSWNESTTSVNPAIFVFGVCFNTGKRILSFTV
jgi:hypothetical protein